MVASCSISCSASLYTSSAIKRFQHHHPAALVWGSSHLWLNETAIGSVKHWHCFNDKQYMVMESIEPIIIKSGFN
jgi:hypothetical protein